MQLFLATFLVFSLQLFSMTVLESLFLLSDSRQFVPFLFLSLGLGAGLQLIKGLRRFHAFTLWMVPLSLVAVLVAFLKTAESPPPFAALFAAFFFLGSVIAHAFHEGPLTKLYLLDMFGALLGTGFYFLTISVLGGEKALFVLIFFGLLLPLSQILSKGRLALLAFGLGIIVVPISKKLPLNFLFSRPAIHLPDRDEVPALNNAYRALHEGLADYIATAWSTLGRVDLFWQPSEEQHWLYYNNAAFTPILADVGDYLHPHHLMPKMSPALIIGAGGGVDILQLQKLGVQDITSLEINEGTHALMKSPYVQELTRNRIDPDRYLMKDARAFLEERTHRYNYIAMTFTELVYERNTPTIAYQNYLYTLEGTKAIWDNLSTDGIFLMIRTGEGDFFHKPDAYRTLITLRDFLQGQELDPKRHLVVVESHKGQVATWVKKSPWNPEDYAKYFGHLQKPDALLFPEPALSTRQEGTPAIVHSILLRNMGPDEFFKEHGLDISPITDDRPYLYFHLKYDNWFYFYLSFALACLLLFFGALWRFRKIGPHALWSHSEISFLGFGAGLFQVALMYDTTFLFVHPTYSVAFILCTWLIAGVCASFLYRRFEEIRSLSLVSFGVVLLFLLTWGKARLALMAMGPGLKIAVFALMILPVAVFSSGWFLKILEDSRSENSHHGLLSYFFSSLAMIAGSGLCSFFMFHVGVRNSVYLALTAFAAAYVLLFLQSLSRAKGLVKSP